MFELACKTAGELQPASMQLAACVILLDARTPYMLDLHVHVLVATTVARVALHAILQLRDPHAMLMHGQPHSDLTVDASPPKVNLIGRTLWAKFVRPP